MRYRVGIVLLFCSLMVMGSLSTVAQEATPVSSTGTAGEPEAFVLV